MFSVNYDVDLSCLTCKLWCINYLFQACIVLSLCESNTYTEILTLSEKYQCMVYYGNALFHLGEFTKAEVRSLIFGL